MKRTLYAGFCVAGRDDWGEGSVPRAVASGLIDRATLDTARGTDPPKQSPQDRTSRQVSGTYLINPIADCALPTTCCELPRRDLYPYLFPVYQCAMRNAQWAMRAPVILKIEFQRDLDKPRRISGPRPGDIQESPTVRRVSLAQAVELDALHCGQIELVRVR